MLSNFPVSRNCSVARATLLSAIFLLLTACSSSEDRQEQYFAKAQSLYEEGDLKRAGVEVRNVLQINSNHVKGRYLLAKILASNQVWDQMFANLMWAVELDPEFIDARLMLGQMYYRGQSFTQAREQATAVLALRPDNPDGLTLLGSVLYREGDHAGAIEQARRALELSPGHVGAISVIAEVYKQSDPDVALAAIGEGMAQRDENATLQIIKIDVLEEQGDVEGVIRTYRELIADYPEDLYFHYNLVKFYEQHERLDEAESLLRDIVNTQPDNLQLKLWLAEFIASQRNLELAEATVREFIGKQPDIRELRFALGKVLAAQGRISEAEAVFREIVTEDGEGADSLQARNEIARLYLQNEAVDDAERLFAEILEIERENAEALVARARLLMSDGQYQTAITNLRTVIKNDPANMEALLLIAEAYEATNADDLALDSYRDALQRSPANTLALNGTARLLVDRREYEAADRLLEQYLEFSPESPDATSLLVASYSAQQRWADALVHVERFKQRGGDPTLATYLEGRVNLLSGRLDLAIEAFEDILRTSPESKRALAQLVEAYVASQRFEQAERYLDAHLANNPGQAHAHEVKGRYLMGRGRVEEAEMEFEAALSIEPGSLSASIALGSSYFNRGELLLARQQCESGLRANPQSKELMALLAGVHEQQGQYAAARDLYEAALAVDAGFIIAANNLAVLLVDRFADTESIQRAYSLTFNFDESEKPQLLDTRGWVYYRMGEYYRALELFQRTVALDGDNPIYRYHFGMTYYQLKIRQQAEAELLLAVKNGDSFYGYDEAVTTLAEIQDGGSDSDTGPTEAVPDTGP